MKQYDLENDEKIKSGFVIPEQFFEDFEANILNKINKKEVEIISMYHKPKFWISGIAAIFIISLCTTFYYSSQDLNKNQNDDLLAFENNITNEDIIEHLTDEDITAIEQSILVYDEETIKFAQEYLN